jgi:hypothetical protein
VVIEKRERPLEFTDPTGLEYRGCGNADINGISVGVKVKDGGDIQDRIRPLDPLEPNPSFELDNKSSAIACGFAVGGFVLGGVVGELLEGVVARIGVRAASKGTSSALADASSAAFQAADDIAGWYPKVKHLLSGAGSKARFATDSADEVRALVQEGLRSPNAIFAPNPNLEGTFRVITDMGRAIGIKGQQFLRTIVGADGKVINSFPVNGL